MRRVLLSCALSLVCVAGGMPLASAAPPRASLTGFVCERSPQALNRVIAVVGVMRPITGTDRMQMRFVLARRASSTALFTPVRGGDLGRWLRPKPPTLGQRPSDVWRLRKLVANLVGPATYHFRVSFRWLGASGTTLKRTTLSSPLCQEP